MQPEVRLHVAGRMLSMQLKRCGLAALVILLCPCFVVGQDGSAAPGKPAKPHASPKQDIRYLEPNPENYRLLATQAEAMLRRDVLAVWFPRCVDQHNGGFASNFTRDWKPDGSDGKFSVFQGRMTWISSQIAVRRPELRAQFLPIAQHGLEFLDDVLWDKQDGGFFWGLDDSGNISPSYSDGKELYGESFGLYGAAAAYEATQDPKALELAQRAFRWIDEHAHDHVNGGYFEFLRRDGTPVEAGSDVSVKTVPVGGFLMGYKSMNTHIHLLEALTQLYQVWKEDTVRQRLEEMLAIVRDKICVQPGVMNLFFTNDWRPIPDHDSYGHDVETAYLMLEAEDVLGQPHDPKTLHMARMLVDHALAYGWDKEAGGFFGEGTTFGKPEDHRKDWWVEMEGLNSLLLMHEMYGHETDRYFRAFQQQWDWIKNRQVDSQFRGVYATVGPDGPMGSTNKGGIWKAGYHDGRALLNVTARLRKLAQASPAK
ncbi:MAG TPA: AGE family epimerase/isomerase [Terriglobales bacterium]